MNVVILVEVNHSFHYLNPRPIHYKIRLQLFLQFLLADFFAVQLRDFLFTKRIYSVTAVYIFCALVHFSKLIELHFFTLV